MKTMFAPFRQKRLRICGLLAACAIAAGSLGAQRPSPRIFSEISNSEQATLKGSQHPLALAQNDAGRMPADTRLSGISMFFNRSAAQQADLEALLTAQQDPASKLYHKWLTPDQFAARFGMAQSDLDKVGNWLQQQGFAIDSVTRSRNAIRFTGTVGQVESAFSTQMHFYQSGGSKHFAPSTELSIPTAIAPAVATIRNLNDFRPRPQHVVPRSSFTSGKSGVVFFAPADIATVYDIKPLYSASVNGAGQSIVIVGQSLINVSDIENFESAAGLTKKDPELVLVPGTGTSVTSTGDQSESDLDVEWSGGIAPGANIILVYTGSNHSFGVYDSVQYAVDQKIAPIISMSYASCETELTVTDAANLEAVFAQAAAQGQTVISASGDQGSTACSGDTHLTTVQQQAVVVNYPSSSAYVTGMGGTEIIPANSVSTNSTYWLAETPGTDVLTSAVKYIPEVAWNDDDSQLGLSASGGGASTLVARPKWQAGVAGIASGSFRLVPDISLYSSPGLPGYLYCTSDTGAWAAASTNGPAQAASCDSGFRDGTSGGNYLTVAGGTSFAAPIFAGMVAMINQNAGYVTGQGLVNPTLYKLAANSATYASAFHDVTSGDNNCTAGATFCSSTTGFAAGTGYDEVTGLGSVDFANLVAAWPMNTGSTAGLIGTTTTVTPSDKAPKVNVSDTFTVSVAAQSGTGVPTGSVTLQIDGGTALGGTTVTGNTVTANGTLTYSTSFAAAGDHQVLAQYLGDATHAQSTGVGSITIATTSSNGGTFKLLASDLTVKQGSSGTSTITVTPAGGYTGTVDLSFTTSNNTALANLCYSFANALSTGDGSVAITGKVAVTTVLTLDANASDCISTTTGSKNGFHRLRVMGGGNSSRNTGTNPVPASLAFAGLLLAGWLGRSSRKLRNLACLIALAAAGFAVTACGSSTVSSKAANPPKGTYTVTVTGTDTATATITGNTSLSLTIN